MDQAGNLRTLSNLKKRINTMPVARARVITITSGKGGVGKTNIALNMGLYLQSQGHRVIVLDADLGLANIEILLGIAPKYSLMDLLGGKRTLEETITRLPSGLGIISGGSGLVELANISDEMLRAMVDKLDTLDEIADIILIDTGAGISNTVLKFVMAAGESILVCAPEPTSITDAYALVKSVKEKEESMPKFKVIVNRVDDNEEGINIFRNLQKVAERFLSINLTYLGTIPYDPNLVRAVKQQNPCVLSYPATPFTKEVEKIGRRVMDLQMENAPVGMRGFMQRLVNVFND